MKILTIGSLHGVPLSNLGEKESTEDRANRYNFSSETFNIGIKPMQGEPTMAVGCGIYRLLWFTKHNPGLSTYRSLTLEYFPSLAKLSHHQFKTCSNVTSRQSFTP